MRILILSTHSPNRSAGLGADLMHALEARGHHVDFISKFENEKDTESYFPIKRKSKTRKIISKLLPKPIKGSLIEFKNWMFPPKVIFNAGLELHYLDESRPGLDAQILIDKINGKYDLVITLWWFDFLTSQSLKAVYDKLKCPILIYAIDMAPITGGCFYFKDCRNFMKECGCCPCLGSTDPHDQTHANYLIKKKNYESSAIYFAGNSWMNDWAVNSSLFSRDQVKLISCIIDDKEFSPVNLQEAKKTLGIDKKCFVILARSSQESRKGANHIVYAIKQLWANLSCEERNEFRVLTVGDSTIEDEIATEGIPCINYGRVTRNRLIELYRCADYFLSASEDDAGPSMVNQSMMCGTPVIAFNNGVAVDVVIDGETGFKSDEVSSQAFAVSLQNGYDCCEKDSLRLNARRVALAFNSNEAVAKAIEQVGMRNE